jgi:hypothetical protein
MKRLSQKYEHSVLFLCGTPSNSVVLCVIIVVILKTYTEGHREYLRGPQRAFDTASAYF